MESFTTVDEVQMRDGGDERLSHPAGTGADDAATAELRTTVRLLRDAVGERQALTRRLMRAQEDERRRIAADIHDDSLQALLAVGLKLQLLRRKVDDAEVVELVAELEKAVAEAGSRLRHLLFDLRPPSLERGGVAVALGDLAHELLAPADISWRLEGRITTEPPEPVKTVLYRIAREALTNIVKHAGATTVTAAIRGRRGGVLLRVEDDGAGFDAAAAPSGHYGLAQMREQAELAAGWLQVRSSPGEGTLLELWLPGDEAEERPAEPTDDPRPALPT
ncbi:MAG TPA: histidine kinase [Acidimicrobiales bacterium]|nr:histidine kinase [Acidimicrobiales bacterium]